MNQCFFREGLELFGQPLDVDVPKPSPAVGLAFRCNMKHM